MFNRLCGLVVQLADHQARGREFEPRRTSVLLFVALGHILFLWLAATSVALGHQTYL